MIGLLNRIVIRGELKSQLKSICSNNLKSHTRNVWTDLPSGSPRILITGNLIFQSLCNSICHLAYALLNFARRIGPTWAKSGRAIHKTLWKRKRRVN
jgi:hypothetical protein